MTTNQALPPDLYNRIATLGYFSAPHRDMPEQREAKDNLHRVLAQGAIDDLPHALRQHGYAWVKNVKGRYIEGENWVTDTAYQLAREIELVINSRQQIAA